MVASLLREQLRAELTARMRAKDRGAVSAIRSVLGALDNAEAVPVDGSAPTSSEFVAGAAIGVGSTEVPRRELTAADEHAIVRDEISQLRELAATVPTRADDALAQAEVLAAVLERSGS